MGYKLELEADTITELADKVRSHYKELESIVNVPASLTNATAEVINQNFAAARSEPLVSPAEMKALHEEPIEDVTGQVDADGLPWDERIHSSNKKKTAKGVWVARRGVDDITRASVVNELRGVSVSAAPASIPAPLGDIPAHIAQAHISAVSAYTAPEYTAPVAQVVPPAAPAVATPAQYTITDVFGKIQPMFAANMTEAQTYINSLTQRLSIQFQVQVQSINDIAGRPDMIAFAMQLMANDGK